MKALESTFTPASDRSDDNGKDEINSLKAKINELELLSTAATDKHKQELADAKVAAELQSNEQRSALNKCDARIETLSAELEGAESELQEFKAKCEDLSAEIVSLQTHCAAAEDVTAGEFVTKDRTRSSTQFNASTHRRETFNDTQSRGSASEPDVLYIGNSLSKGLTPGKLFAPFYTKVVTLENKTLEGATEFLDQAGNIKPKVVVLHCLENNISKESGPTVVRKLKGVISKYQLKFHGTPVMVVDPIGRGRNQEQYDNTAQYVRENLHTVVKKDLIINTDELHEADRKLFASDLTHLKPAGYARLCISLKQQVYPLLGKEYVLPSERQPSTDRRETPSTDRRETLSQRPVNKRKKQHLGKPANDEDMVALVSLLKTVFQR